jgi:hypothetical protein
VVLHRQVICESVVVVYLVLAVVAFVLELGVLGAVCCWAFGLVDGVVPGLALALAAVVIMAGLWAVFGSPRAVVPLTGAPDVLFRLAWFGAGAVAAGLRFGWAVGLVFAAVYVLDAVGLLLVPH